MQEMLLAPGPEPLALEKNAACMPPNIFANSEGHVHFEAGYRSREQHCGTVLRHSVDISSISVLKTFQSSTMDRKLTPWTDAF